MTLTNEKPFIAGNWKLYMTSPQAVELVSELQEKSHEFEEAQMVVIPPFTALCDVHITLQGSSIEIGAQNLFWEDEGAYTGEISAPMLKDVGCAYVVIGHSERRQYFGETNATVNKKIRAALAHKLTPILCIGESLEEREKGETINKVKSQISEGLDRFDKDTVQKIIIAYEPIWAIGTGLTATPEQAEEVHDVIRRELSEKYGKETASCAIILYGGSVKPANTFSLLKEKDINGALVGGASLKAESFADIAKEAIKAYKEK
jgi:triosephosphate isomerase